MISIDFECSNMHRFEGHFSDHDAYTRQLDHKMIACPICNTRDVKRIYTGCSIRTKTSEISRIEKLHPNIFDAIKAFNKYVQDNFENVGRGFADTARAIHYGIEKERNIYGESTLNEIEELLKEDISILPLIDLDKIEN
jgi:hypothetical protein